MEIQIKDLIAALENFLGKLPPDFTLTYDATTKEAKKNTASFRSKMRSYFESRLIGQSEEIKKMVYLFCEYVKNAESGKNFNAPSWMLTAPSGCGKTEVYRILRDFFKQNNISIPVIQLDLTHFTESGFKGKDPIELFEIIDEANNKSGASTAIVFLDEADKKMKPRFSKDGEDVNAASQSDWLSIIEGAKHEISNARVGSRTIDTSKVMFVLVGAFQSIRNEKQKQVNSKNIIGFSSDSEYTAKQNERNILHDDISFDDMIEFGMIEELAGRMVQIINLHKLSEEDMKKVILEKAHSVSAETGIDIELSDTAMTMLLNVAYSNLGIRSVLNRIKELAYKAVTDVYYEESYKPENFIIQITSSDSANIKSKEDITKDKNEYCCE